MARKKYKKRPDGRYETTVKTGTNPNTGRPIRVHIYARTVKELETKRAELIKQRDSGLICNQPTIFSEYAQKWLELNKSGKSANTRRMYQNTLKLHTDLLNSKRIDKITKSDVQLQLKQQEGHRATQEFMLLTIKQVLDNAVDDGLILRNVADNIKLDTERKTVDRRPFTEFELQAIDQADLDPEERCFVSLALYTGMRRGEIFALDKCSIDLRSGVIHVNKTAVYVKKQTEITPPKSNAGFRDVPILEALKPTLKSYLASLETEYLFVRKQKKSGNFEPLSSSQIHVFWKRIYQKLNESARKLMAAGVMPDVINISDPMHGISPHWFRHNFATILYYSGVDMKEASRIMGHANTSITLETYTHLKISESASASKVNQYLMQG